MEAYFGTLIQNLGWADLLEGKAVAPSGDFFRAFFERRYQCFIVRDLLDVLTWVSYVTAILVLDILLICAALKKYYPKENRPLEAAEIW